MSWECTAYVRKLRKAPNGEPLKCLEKELLYTLADSHNSHQREAWPSLLDLAEDALLSKRKTIYLLDELERKGVILRIRGGGSGRMNTYVFLEIDPDPRLQHSLNHEDCLACEDMKRKGLKTPEVQGREKKRQKKSAQCAPFQEAEECTKGAATVHEGCTKGAQVSNDIRKNLELTTYKNKSFPDSEKSESDPRHKPFREFFQKCHAEANEMAVELVPWNGREGIALKNFLQKHPKIVFEQFKRCVLNYYRSDLNISQRPARAIPRLLEFWAGEVNQFGTPRQFDQKAQREERLRMEAQVGRNTWRPP